MATLQEAIQATRNGNKIEAQKILADILKLDMENTQAWYLLSLLVDSPEKKDAYLKRVITLDPTHEKALDDLAGSHSSKLDFEPVVEQETAVSPSAKFEDPSDFSGDSNASSLPSWLDGENPTVTEDMLVEEEPSEIFNSEQPDWLSNKPPTMSVLDEPLTVPTAMTPKDASGNINLEEEEGTALQFDDLSTHVEHTNEPFANSPATLQPEPTSTPSLIGWNITLILLSFLLILTLLTIGFQLINLFQIID